MPASSIDNNSLFLKIKKASIDSINKPGKTTIKLPKQDSKMYPMVFLFRHGETFDNKNKVFSGWRDSKITSKGKKQAEVLASRLKVEKIDICITSPLVRSKETARIALKNHKKVVFEEDERIIERNYGDLSGHSKEVMMRENPELAVKYRRGYDFPPPHGESLEMVERRVFPFCEELVNRIKKDNINVAVSAHGNSMRAMRRYFEKMSIVEELTHENPLATDYCRYVIKVKKYRKDKGHFTKKKLKSLYTAKEKIFGVLRTKLF